MSLETGLRIHKEQRRLLVPETELLRELMPHTVTTSKYLTIPHYREETRLLRNLGYPAPSPILWHYDWPGLQEPFESQKKTAALLSMNLRAYVLNTMGTGKTRAACFAADFLLREKEVSKVLVVAPLSTLTPTWLNELRFTFPHRTARVVHGSRAQRKALLKEPADFYIINHDGIKTCLPDLQAAGFDCVIIDELAAFREKNTERWKAMRTLTRPAKFLWGLTGAPTPNAPTDAFAQAALIRPETVSSFNRFRERTMTQVSNYKWIARPDANDYVHALLQPSVRYRLEDCIDIPPTTYLTREVRMSPSQTKFYNLMMDKLAVQFRQHEITAANEGVKLSKLLQIAGGYVYASDRTILGLNPADRLRELKELIDEVDSKVIVFVSYIHMIHGVRRFLTEKKVPCHVLYGATAKNARDAIFADFQTNPNGRRVLLAHPKTMSHGLTLTAATMIIWFSPTDSLDTYIQANARIARPGQTNKTTIVHLEGSPVEKRVYARLSGKQKVQGSLLGMFAKVNDGY